MSESIDLAPSDRRAMVFVGLGWLVALVVVLAGAAQLLRPFGAAVPLEPGSCKESGGQSFSARVRQLEGPGLFRLRAASAVGVDPQLWEDGVPLGPRAENRGEVARGGRGAFSIEDPSEGVSSRHVGLVFFSSSDGSNPCRNGRSYAVTGLTAFAPTAAVFPALLWLGGSGVVLAGFLYRRAIVHYVASSGALSGRAMTTSALFGTFTVYALLFVSESSPPSSWTLPFLAVCVVLWSIGGGRGNRMRRPRLGEQLWALGLVSWLAYSGLGAMFGAHGAPEVWIATVLALVAGALVVASSMGRLGQGGGHPSLFVVVLAMASCVFLGLEGFGFDLDSWLEPYWTLRSRWTEKVAMTWTLALSWLAWAGLPRGRAPAAALLVLLGVTSFSSTMYSTRPAFLVSLGVCAAVHLGGRKVVPWLGAAVALLILCAPLLVAGGWQASSSRFDESIGWHQKVAGRLVLWEYSRRLIVERPFLGWGYGASWTFPDRDESLDLHLSARIAMEPLDSEVVLGLPGGHPHSLPLLVWIEGGLVGALLFVSFLLGVFRTVAGIENSRHRAGIAAGVVSLLVIYFLNFPVQRPSLVYPLVLFAAVASSLMPGGGEMATPRPSRGEKRDKPLQETEVPSG